MSPVESMQPQTSTSSTTPDDTSRAAEVAQPGAVARVEQAVAALGELDARPLSDHPELYQRLHTQLQQALAEIDSGESRPANGR